MQSTINILVLVAIAAVFVTLVAGIYTVYRGGDFAQKYSNKLMRLRVLLQFVAICVVMLALVLSGNMPG